MRPTLIFCALFSISFSTVTTAEIYQCKQTDGRTSFSNTPCPSQVINGTSEAHILWNEMNLLVKEGSEVNSRMGPDYYSILACNSESEVFIAKLSRMEKSLQKLSRTTHKKMYLAMEALHKCGACSASAPKYCQTAKTHLMEETNVLASSLR